MTTIFCVRPTCPNIGNDTIYLGVRSLLQSAFGAPINIVQVPAGDGCTGNWVHGLTPDSIYEMNQYGDGVVVGGGNLYENGGLDVDPHSLAALRPPLMLLSLSYGRIYDRRGMLVPRTDSVSPAIVRALNERADLSIARDDATLEYLNDLDVADARLGGCPSLLLEQGARRGDGSAGTLVSIRHPRLMSIPPFHRARVHASVAAMLEMLRGRDLGPVRLLCHDVRDIEFASSFDDVEYICPDDVHAYIELLRTARLVVSFRLHAFLPCVALGTPAVNISYDERSLSLARTIGFGDWDVDLIGSGDVAADVASRCDRLEDFERIREDTRGRRQQIVSTLRDAAGQFAALVREYRTGRMTGGTEGTDESAPRGSARRGGLPAQQPSA